jgi:hypothetical protein
MKAVTVQEAGNLVALAMTTDVEIQRFGHSLIMYTDRAYLCDRHGDWYVC